MKLELKHLAPYLPYGLQIEHPTMLIGKRKISELKNLGKTNIEISHRLYVQISECKPILRPISDLTIEFINTDVVLREFQPEFIIGNRFEWNYAFVQRLFELHLDYFSLIEKGLAISIHDVEQVIA